MENSKLQELFNEMSIEEKIGATISGNWSSI